MIFWIIHNEITFCCCSDNVLWNTGLAFETATHLGIPIRWTLIHKVFARKFINIDFFIELEAIVLGHIFAKHFIKWLYFLVKLFDIIVCSAFIFNCIELRRLLILVQYGYIKRDFRFIYILRLAMQFMKLILFLNSRMINHLNILRSELFPYLLKWY